MISKSLNKFIIKNVLLALQSKANSTCPAPMFAKSRKHSVIERIPSLIISIKQRIEARYQGEPLGTLLLKKFFFEKISLKEKNQNLKAMLKLNPNLVVKG